MRQSGKILFFTVCMILGLNKLSAQELKCQVNINAQKITEVDPAIFTTMKTAVEEFMNTRSWTTDQFGPEEKIECSLFFNFESSASQDVYNARVTVQSSRPVFNSSYNSPVLNFIDNDWIVTYAQNQQIQFSITQYNSNLTSLLAFYAYVIIGLDYETMSKGGGTKWFTLAEQIMNNVPTNAPDAKGWRPYDGNANRNRYWLINNLQNGKYQLFRDALYEYHFQGLDNFYEKPALARANILNALTKMKTVFSNSPNNMLVSVFFLAKSDELVNIFSGADMGEKSKALVLLRSLDPSNSSKYDKLVRN